jgi:hypothetical protein
MRPLLPLLLLAAPAAADDFTPLFNGRDLTGWVNVNTAPGTFAAKGDQIVTTGSPTGFLRTARQYENFVLEFEWMHTRPSGMANSGLFVWGDPLPAVGTGYTRGIEVQVLINYEADWATSHGDIFSIWGARCTPDRPHPKGAERCLPSERRVMGAGHWNHYKVVANDGVIKLHVNGKEVSGVSRCSPRKGYLALESEGAPCHFRNIKIRALPSTNPPPAEVADEWAGHTSLFDGLTLTGFAGDGWEARDGVLRPTAGATALRRTTPLPVGELIFDWRLPGKGGATYPFQWAAGDVAGPHQSGKAGAWHRAKVRVAEAGTGPQWPAAAGVELRNLFFAPSGEK